MKLYYRFRSVNDCLDTKNCEVGMHVAFSVLWEVRVQGDVTEA